MSVLEQICDLEAHRLELLRLDWRCEMSQATTTEPADYRANRAGLVSVQNRVKG